MAIPINKIDCGEELFADSKSPKIEEMKADIVDICKTISLSSSQFEAEELFSKIKDYVNQYDRLLYAEISTYCYNLDSEELDDFQGNLTFLVEYVHSQDFENELKADGEDGAENEAELLRRTKRIIIKLYDNVNLACSQMNSLRRSEEELHQHFVSEFEPAKSEITKDISSQLITLVGIFTAIAFLVFGGFSSLADIFSHLGDSIPRTIMLASIWGLFICDGIFVFLGCIERIVQKESVTLIGRNWLFVITNLILLFIFSISLWASIIDKYNWGNTIIQLGSCSIVPILGFIVIIAGFALAFGLIIRYRRR